MFPAIIIAVVIGSFSLVGIYNFFTASRLKKDFPKQQPSVSILIPARNEEKNIASCLTSVLSQNYSDYEVIVCDDHSQDRTAEIIKSFQNSYPKLTLISGKPLPEGWTGKTWACQQLGLQAKGELLLFIDADVTLEPDALYSAIALKEKKKVSMLSCFPQQVMKTIGEWMLVPLIDWLLLSFVLLDLVYRTAGTRFCVAIGQFILIEQEVYQRIGRHEAVKTAVTEDVELSRILKSSGEKILVARSLSLVHCRMYRNFMEARDGMARFFYLGSKMKPISYVASLLGILALFSIPLYLFFVNRYYLLLFTPMIIQRILTSILAGQNALINLLLMPIHYFFTFYISSYSLYVALTNKIEWKGRRINLKSLADHAQDLAKIIQESKRYQEWKQRINGRIKEIDIRRVKEKERYLRWKEKIEKRRDKERERYQQWKIRLEELKAKEAEKYFRWKKSLDSAKLKPFSQKKAVAEKVSKKEH
ncbi:glycosyltransferase [Candidatus Woesearchaeota archaeon]|nr:glycosyltransferase [Candidatus Woesearchaeota archaeon]